MKGFDLKMDQIHNDTTSVTVSGAYDAQNPKAVQLKRGHNKDGRPDLKQLVYSLCVTADGAVPVHFKAYDGNQTDDGVHLETWNRLRTLLRHPRFIYVADWRRAHHFAILRDIAANWHASTAPRRRRVSNSGR
jgi:transposase